MRLISSFAASLWLLGKLVEAGTHSRGPEALYFYYAYRLDVEVSSSMKVPEAWKLAPGGNNDPEDWPDNEVDETRKGMNFHAFIAKVAKGGYGRVAGRQKVADPWFPTTEELVDLARWPRDDGMPLDPIDSTKTNRFSYVGVAPRNLLGKLNEAGKKPGDYFNLENLMAIVANRAMDRYEKNTAVGQRYYNEMRKCVKEAQIARKIDGGDHTKDTSWKLLEQWLGAQPDKYKVEKKNIEKSLLKQQTVTVLPAESTIFAGSQYKDMDWVATRTAITKKVGKKAVGGVFYKGNLFKFFKKMAADMVSCASTFVSWSRCPRTINSGSQGLTT
jgi:hypothetical protein